MSSLSQYDGWTVEEVAAKNSHELTAMHLLQAREFIVEERARYEQGLADARSVLDETQRVGLAVLRAKRAGRKTVRISEVAP